MRVENASLQLEGYYVTSLQVSLPKGAEKTAGILLGIGVHPQRAKLFKLQSYSIKFEVDGQKNAKQPNRYRLQLRVFSEKGTEPAPPYHFDVTVVGFFKFDGTNLTPELDEAILNNCATILYSALREMLAGVTGRGPLPALVLPTFTFASDHKSAPPSPPKRIAKSAKSSKAHKPAKNPAHKPAKKK